MNSEGHYLVVISVANYSDGHYILPQISLPGSDCHYSLFTVLSVSALNSEATRIHVPRNMQCHIHP